ncbi:hypothetical protein ACF07Y_37205 [Streptomyces sp. NPDC016566]|uniref:hypothetical protein n=1 Tax=Streptomyces sp. NPDC016566 TaxID=3364967 RepID=UPI0036F754A4
MEATMPVRVAIGFYAGIYGRGTAPFSPCRARALLATEFVQSSALAKVVIAGTNLGALLVSTEQGHVM